MGGDGSGPLLGGWGRLRAEAWDGRSRRSGGCRSTRRQSLRQEAGGVPLEPETPALGPQWVPCSHYKEKKKEKKTKAGRLKAKKKEGKERGRNWEKTRETEALAIGGLPKLPLVVRCLPVWGQKVCHACWNLHPAPGCVLE